MTTQLETMALEPEDDKFAVCEGPPAEDTPSKESYWWHVNKGGFPIPSHTWEKMWQHVIDVHPHGDCVAKEIRDRPQKKVSIPTPPMLSQKSPVYESLLSVQAYMNTLQYNHTGTQFFDIRKSAPLTRLMESAKEIVKESLPIKCLEAVVLGLYFTSPLNSVQRFAVGFKSKCGGLYYRHIVLGVHWNSLYGALGMSRRDTLMYKPLTYTSLGELISDYLDSYKEVGHTVVKVKMSPPITHNLTNHATIQWKHFSLFLKDVTDADQRKAFEKYSKAMRSM